jgi:thiosulfate dehydrogenase [quinone] large subunit
VTRGPEAGAGTPGSGRQTRAEHALRSLAQIGRSPAAALVPLRFFLGGTFLYAGLDKLLRPGFFEPTVPGSIQDQLASFARHSPLAPLIHLVQPWAVEVGVVVAIVEIAAGLGALSGYGFRLAAAAGAGLGLLFWLSASWATTPYYYGPDLPYAAGWITLALAGHGDVLVPLRVRGRAHAAAPSPSPTFKGRRALLEAAVLGAAAVVVAGVAIPLGRLGRFTAGAGGTADGPGVRSPTPGTTAPPGRRVASVADLQPTGATGFTVPFDAPAPLPAGDPGVIVRLTDGSFVAFDAVCPHAGCRVEWDQGDGRLVCPCHGAVFDPGAGGAAVEGPTTQPLASLPITLDEASGTFVLASA